MQQLGDDECPNLWRTTRLACSPPTKVQDSIPGRVTPGFSYVGFVPDDAAGRRIFSGISRFPRSSILVLLQPHFNSPHWLKGTILLEGFHEPGVGWHLTLSLEMQDGCEETFTIVCFERIPTCQELSHLAQYANGFCLTGNAIYRHGFKSEDITGEVVINIDVWNMCNISRLYTAGRGIPTSRLNTSLVAEHAT
ncbi:hypothetical protein PR048_028404 [Dryococelus australis]|uniref:Uncharacterized protein n=1 Tax=Dryococelus australis TaxID=614101 RepID=A0ABQ9GE92_9NEOP|nr:hypothetical protein PR048_028404 [Dryococelus australis]